MMSHLQPEAELEEKLRRLARMDEFVLPNYSSPGVPGALEDMNSDYSCSRELALAQMVSKDSLYQPQLIGDKISSILRKGKPTYQSPSIYRMTSQPKGTDGARMDPSSLKGKSFSYTPKGTYNGDGASLVYTQANGVYDSGKGVYANSRGTYSPGNSNYSSGRSGGKGGYASAGSGGKGGGGKGGSSSGSSSSGSSGGSSGGGGK